MVMVMKYHGIIPRITTSKPWYYHYHTVRLWLLETSLWKLSAGFRPSFLVDIGNWLAGSGSLSFQSCAPQARKILRAACGVRTEQRFLTGGNALLGCLGRMVRESREVPN